MQKLNHLRGNKTSQRPTSLGTTIIGFLGDALRVTEKKEALLQVAGKGWRGDRGGLSRSLKSDTTKL